MRISIVFILFSFTLIAHAQSAPGTDLEFQGIHLGQTPTNEMICVSGPCLANETEARQSIVSKYNLPVDITHYGGVKISSPGYDFFDNQLYQVGFRLECKTEKAKACIDTVVIELKDHYGLEQVTDAYKEYSDHQAAYFYQYLTDMGAVVAISWEKSRNRWGYPSVKIYEKPLLDAVRMFSNPKYIPKELMRVASNRN